MVLPVLSSAPMSPELDKLIQWALNEHHAQKRQPPVRLHSAGNRDDDPKTMDRDTARGLPHSKAFEKYLDGAPINTPARQAVSAMRSDSRSQSPEYRIAHALIVEGNLAPVSRHPPEVVHRALATVRTLTENRTR